MPTAYTGPGWENPETGKTPIGGSDAFWYVHDGFPVAHVFNPGYVDRENVERGLGIYIYNPEDAHRTTPMQRVRDLDEAERFIKAYRNTHPSLAARPVPLKTLVPPFKKASDATGHIALIEAELERGEFDLHGRSARTVAGDLYLFCQRDFIDQDAIDRAQLMCALHADLSK